MKISAIISSRDFEFNPNYHLIYEWEEDFATILKVPIVTAKPLHRKLVINRYTKKLINIFGKNTLHQVNNLVSSTNQGYNFVFELYVGMEPDFATASNVVPLMVDFWKHTDLDTFYALYRNCKLVLISSLEAFNFLKAKNCPITIAHLGLSLSDRYQLEQKTTYEKKYDILLAGRLNIRTNQVLRDYLETFVKKFPGIEYLYQEEIKGEYYYVSTKRGMIGKFQTREEYMSLLRASKVSFYSTPGLDGGEKRTGGFNPVTPRYLELLSAQCLLVGRYPDNAETQYYELPRVCPNVESYEHFETVLRGYLADATPNFDNHRAILDKHYTSVRAWELRQIMAARS